MYDTSPAWVIATWFLVAALFVTWAFVNTNMEHTCRQGYKEIERHEVTSKDANRTAKTILCERRD